MRTAGVIGGAGGLAATLTALGWPGVAVVVGLAVGMLGTVAWVVADRDRSRHLVMLIAACRAPRK